MAALPPPPIGFPLLPLPDAAGRLNWPSLAQSIEQQIRIVLQTCPGQQLMRPNFGVGLVEFVGQPDGLATRKLIQDRIATGLAQWEPRVTVEAVEAFEDPSAPGLLRIEIRYRIRRTGAGASMGITLALEST